MRSVLKAAMAVALTLAVSPVHAQMLGLSWETNVVLTQADIDTIKGTLASKIHGQPQGATAAWTNSASGNSGSITLLSIGARDGRRCEQIEYRMSAPSRATDRYVLTSCKQLDGSWKLS